MVDFSKIEPYFLKENYLIALLFPGRGVVAFRVLEADWADYIYEELGSFGVDEWKEPARLNISAEDIKNVLEIDFSDRLYQVFYGISPATLRSYMGYPVETLIRNLEMQRIPYRAKFGYIDGFKSPFSAPAPRTETFIPENVNVGFAWWNYGAEGIDESLISLVINRYRITPIRNVPLLTNILNRQGEGRRCRIVTLGGIETSIDYNFRKTWDIDPIPLTANTSVINAAVRRTK